MNFLRRTTPVRKKLLAGLIDGQHCIGELDAPPLKPLQKADPEAFRRQTKNCHHQLRHGIVKIQNDFCAGHFGNQGGKDQNIRHVMYVDKMITTR